MTLNDVLKLLAEECRKAGSQAAWARRHEIWPGYVSDVLHRRKEPGEAILRALGLAKVVRYERAKDQPSD